MAATEITVRNMIANGGRTVEAESLAAGHYYVDTNHRTGVVDVKLPELLVLHVEAATATTVTVGPGTYPPGLASGLGEVTVEIGAGESAMIGPFESGRVQAEHVDVANYVAAGEDAPEVLDPPRIVHSPVMVSLSGAADVAAFRFPRQT